MADDNMKTIFNLTRFEMQYPEFIHTVGLKIANEEILEPIKSRMRGFGYSEKIINETTIQNFTITRNGEFSFTIDSDYKSDDGFDVARGREKGTRKFFSRPTVAKALSWISGGFIRAFSKGHWAGGITASNVITKSISELTPVAQQKLNEATDELLQRRLSE